MSSTITLRGNPVQVEARFPQKGQQAADFSLVGKDLSDVTLANYAGRSKILNIFPSIDTATCAMSVRHFNKDAAGLEGTVVLCISADLPFAQTRFCGAENIANVVTLSTMRGREFMRDYGVALASGPPPACAHVPWWCSMKTTSCCTANGLARSEPSRTTRRR